MSMCRVFSCVVGRGCLLWPVRSHGKTLLAFALLHSTFQGQICLLFRFNFSLQALEDRSPPLSGSKSTFPMLSIKLAKGHIWYYHFLTQSLQWLLLPNYWLIKHTLFLFKMRVLKNTFSTLFFFLPPFPPELFITSFPVSHSTFLERNQIKKT